MEIDYFPFERLTPPQACKCEMRIIEIRFLPGLQWKSARNSSWATNNPRKENRLSGRSKRIEEERRDGRSLELRWSSGLIFRLFQFSTRTYRSTRKRKGNPFSRRLYAIHWPRLRRRAALSFLQLTVSSLWISFAPLEDFLRSPSMRERNSDAIPNICTLADTEKNWFVTGRANRLVNT